MRSLILVLGLVLLTESRPVFSDDTLQLRVEATANLSYRLDCLSGFARCTRPSINIAGQRIGENDRTLLNIWRDLRKAVADEQPQLPVEARALPTAASLATFSSRRLPSVKSIASVPASAAHRDQLERSLLTHFYPAFTAQWNATHKPHLQRLRYGLSKLFARRDFSAALHKGAALFGQRADLLPPVQLIAITGSENGSLATLDNDFAYIESPVGELAADRAPVIVHEFVHHWLAEMQSDQQDLIVEAFTEQTSRCAMTAYHLMEEALAATIGNGYIERLLTETEEFERYARLPGSFYADLTVDRLSKAILPLVTHYVEQSIAIDTDFVDAYTALAEITLEGHCDELSGQLRSNAFVLTSPELQPARQLVQQRLGSTTTFVDIVGEREPANWHLRQHSALSGIVAATRGGLPALRALIPEAVYTEIDKLSVRHQRIVYAWPRSAHSTIYVIVGADVAACAAAMTQFIALNSATFEGAWLPPALPGAGLTIGF